MYKTYININWDLLTKKQKEIMKKSIEIQNKVHERIKI